MKIMKRCVVYGLVGLTSIGAVASFIVLRPRPTRLEVTARTGDDTVVVNRMHPAWLGALVLDQYGRRLRSDMTIHYQWLAGDSIRLSSNGVVQCDKHADAKVRATLKSLVHEFMLRCRPVTSIDAVSWLDLVADDSARDLAFVARGPDGRAVTELRGSVTVGNGSVVGAEGTSIRPKRAGATGVNIEVGDANAHIPVMVYQPVTSFVDNPRGVDLMAMHVSLARGDTIEVPVPKGAFWVTYFSKDRAVPPPTIQLRGDGACALGNGIQRRRITEDEYAKYCRTGNGTRMMIAHGAAGAANVNGVVAIRMMW
jgi:hypothetical protein